MPPLSAAHPLCHWFPGASAPGYPYHAPAGRFSARNAGAICVAGGGSPRTCAHVSTEPPEVAA